MVLVIHTYYTHTHCVTTHTIAHVSADSSTERKSLLVGTTVCRAHTHKPHTEDRTSSCVASCADVENKCEAFTLINWKAFPSFCRAGSGRFVCVSEDKKWLLARYTHGRRNTHSLRNSERV